MIKHLTQCGGCQKEVEARYDHGSPGNVGRFVAPYDWLTVNYTIINKSGIYVKLVERHACPECTPKFVDVLDAL